jgi:hypothetical protein
MNLHAATTDSELKTITDWLHFVGLNEPEVRRTTRHGQFEFRYFSRFMHEGITDWQQLSHSDLRAAREWFGTL